MLKKNLTVLAIATVSLGLSSLALAQCPGEDCEGKKSSCEIKSFSDLQGQGFEISSEGFTIEIEADGTITKTPVEFDAETIPAREIGDGLIIVGDGEITAEQIREFAKMRQRIVGMSRDNPEEFDNIVVSQLEEAKKLSIKRIMEVQGAELSEEARAKAISQLEKMFSFEVESVQVDTDEEQPAEAQESPAAQQFSIDLGSIDDDLDNIERALDASGLRGNMRDAARDAIREKLQALLDGLE